MLSCSYLLIERANGERYPLVGETRQRHFDGINSKPRKLPKNAPTPSRPLHTYPGALTGRCAEQHLRKSPLVETKIETRKNHSAKNPAKITAVT